MEEIDLKEIFTIFWEKKAAIILLALIFAVFGIIYTSFLVIPMYTSTTKLVLVQTSTEKITANELNLNSKLVSTYSTLIRSPKIAKKIIENLGLDTDEESIIKSISVNAVEDTEVINVSVESIDPEVAQNIANEIGTVFTQEVKELYGIENVKVYERAEVSEEPSNINYKKNIAIFVFIGIAIACGYIFIANMLDNTIKNAEAIEKKYNLFVLASIPINNANLTKGGKR